MESNRNMRTHSCLLFLCDFLLKKAWLEEFLMFLSVSVTVIINVKCKQDVKGFGVFFRG